MYWVLVVNKEAPLDEDCFLLSEKPWKEDRKENGGRGGNNHVWGSKNTQPNAVHINKHLRRLKSVARNTWFVARKWAIYGTLGVAYGCLHPAYVNLAGCALALCSSGWGTVLCIAGAVGGAVIAG